MWSLVEWPCKVGCWIHRASAANAHSLPYQTPASGSDSNKYSPVGIIVLYTLLTVTTSPRTRTLNPNSNHRLASRSCHKISPRCPIRTPLLKSYSPWQLRRQRSLQIHLTTKPLGRQDASSIVTIVPHSPLSHEHQVFTNATS